MHVNTLNASLIRGGTSKGLFIHEASLPVPGKTRDDLLLSIMGSPDPSGMQLNGVGGGISSTSKVAIISQSNRPGIDVEYEFGQVSLTKSFIDWSGSCGNLMAAVGLFALNENLVCCHDDTDTVIRCWQKNMGYEFHVAIPAADQTEFIHIPGVPGEGQPIEVTFIDPSCGVSLLPGNKPVYDLMLTDGQAIQATLILGANPTIFVRASDMGLTGKENPTAELYDQIKGDIMCLIEQGAQIMSIPVNPAIRVAWLAQPHPYQTTDGNTIQSSHFDISSRISTEGRVHHAHTGTGAINLACAAKIPGTIPYQIVRQCDKAIRIGHPGGVMEVNALVNCEQSAWVAVSATFIRTAKLIMVGQVFA